MPSSQLKQLKDGFFIDQVNQLGKETFDFKANDFNLDELDSEFSSLYQLFISNKAHWEKNGKYQAVSYLDALCDLMIHYYRCIGAQEKLDALNKKKSEIAAFIAKDNQPSQGKSHKATSLSSFLWKGLEDSTLGYASSLTSSSKLSENISALNANRIYWIYCRGLVNHAVAYLKNSNFHNYIKAINADDYLKMLEKPQKVLYVLSVGIYALRFLINLATITKHIMQAESNDLSTKKVIKAELEERGFTMVNDAVWGTVNLLTNYNEYFNISSAAAANATVVFLAFDVGLLMTRWLFEATKYSNRVQELLDQRQKVQHLNEIEVINRQLDIEADKWEAQSAYYAINIAAAACLVVGFGATLVVSGGLSLAVLSMFGTALYATADEYKNYKESSIAVKRELANGEMSNNDVTHQQLLGKLTAECSNANSNFWKGLAYNAAGPAFIITAGAISWPVALCVTAAYMAYRINNSHKKEASDIKQQDTTGIYRLFGLKKEVQPDMHSYQESTSTVETASI